MHLRLISFGGRKLAFSLNHLFFVYLCIKYVFLLFQFIFNVRHWKVCKVVLTAKTNTFREKVCMVNKVNSINLTNLGAAKRISSVFSAYLAVIWNPFLVTVCGQWLLCHRPCSPALMSFSHELSSCVLPHPLSLWSHVEASWP